MKKEVLDSIKNSCLDSNKFCFPLKDNLHLFICNQETEEKVVLRYGGRMFTDEHGIYRLETEVDLPITFFIENNNCLRWDSFFR